MWVCVGILYPPARSGAPGTRVTESRLSPDGVLGPLSNIIALYGHFCYGGFVFSFFVWVLVLGLALVLGVALALGFIVLSVTPKTNP